jgi:lysophospholipase L1-like esterase
MSLPIYSTGTVAVAAGGTVVTLSGGMWSGINAKQGDFISIAGSAAALITEVTDATHLKIAPWPGAAQTAAAYQLFQNYVGRVVGVAAAEDVGVMLEKLHVDGLPFIVGADETVPDPSYGDDGQMAFQPSTGQWWVKAGGVWVVSAGLTASPSDAIPIMDGMAAAGTSALYSRGDHIHPADTSLASLTQVVRYDATQSPTLPQIVTAQNNINLPAIHRRPLAAWLPKWGAARAKVVAGTSNAKLLIVGDSTALGSGAGPPSYPYSWPTVVASLLTSAGINASWQSRIADGNLTTSLPSLDPRVTMGSSYIVSTLPTLGGSLFWNNSIINVGWRFTPTVPFNTADVYSLTNAGLGSMISNVNGGSGTTIIETGSSAMVKTTITGPLGTTGVLIAPNTGISYFLGVVAYNSAVKEVSILNAGFAGGSVGNFIDASSVWSPLNVLGFIEPDLTIIDLTVNDANLGTAAATYQTNLELIIARAKLTGDVVIIGGAPTVTSFASMAVQLRINNMAAAVAAKNSLNFVSFIDLWKSRDAIIAAGYDSGDGVHISSTGYAAMAAQIGPLLF